MALTAQFKEFASKVYSQQAVAFVNAYWKDLFENNVENRESVYKWVHLFAELDQQNKMEGHDLDEFNAHRFLEKVGETKRVVELREELKQIDLNFDKRVALIEYLLFRFKKKVDEFLARPQGDNSKEIEKAQKLIDEVQQALEAALASAEKAKKDAEVAKKVAAAAAASAAEAAAKAAAAKAKADEAAAAEAEQRSALGEVQAQERARDEKTETLKKKSEDDSIGLVARQRSKNELAQHLAEDPLPLRKSKITLEAATKKAEKARIAADGAADVAQKAKDQADADKAKADAAAKAADASAQQADEAVAATEAKMAEAQAYLAKVQAESGGSGMGAVWWLERELEEKKKYMPKAKGGTWVR